MCMPSNRRWGGTCRQGQGCFFFFFFSPDAISVDHPNFATYQQEVGIWFGDSHNKTDNLKDLETSIKHIQAAVNATPKEHPELPGWHQNLGVLYIDRYRRTGDIQDLEVALKYNLAAVAATPEGHPDFPERQTSLAVSYNDRHRGTGDIQDLEAAFKYDLAAESSMLKLGSVLKVQASQLSFVSLPLGEMACILS
jgi:hypothetical protein